MKETVTKYNTLAWWKGWRRAINGMTFALIRRKNIHIFLFKKNSSIWAKTKFNNVEQNILEKKIFHISFIWSLYDFVHEYVTDINTGK